MAKNVEQVMSGLQIRMKKEHLLVYGIVEGPTKPKTLQGYLDVLVEDLKQLMDGVPVYNSFLRKTTTLRGFLFASISDYRGHREVTGQHDAGRSDCKLALL